MKQNSWGVVGWAIWERDYVTPCIGAILSQSQLCHNLFSPKLLHQGLPCLANGLSVHSMPGIGCVFKNIYKFGCTRSYLQHMGSSVFIVACRIVSCGMWDPVPNQGLNHRPPALGAQSLSPWTTREVLGLCLIFPIAPAPSRASCRVRIWLWQLE